MILVQGMVAMSDEDFKKLSDEDVLFLHAMTFTRSGKHVAHLISILKTDIASKVVVRQNVNKVLILESAAIARAIGHADFRITKDQMTEIIEVAKDYETLDGGDEDFEQEKRKIKEERERLEEHFKNLFPNSN